MLYAILKPSVEDCDEEDDDEAAIDAIQLPEEIQLFIQRSFSQESLNQGDTSRRRTKYSARLAPTSEDTPDTGPATRATISRERMFCGI